MGVTSHPIGMAFCHSALSQNFAFVGADALSVCQKRGKKAARFISDRRQWVTADLLFPTASTEFSLVPYCRGRETEEAG